jgi:hypothetical protein
VEIETGNARSHSGELALEKAKDLSQDRVSLLLAYPNNVLDYEYITFIVQKTIFTKSRLIVKNHKRGICLIISTSAHMYFL